MYEGVETHGLLETRSTHFYVQAIETKGNPAVY